MLTDSRRMEIADAAGGDMEAGLLVATTSATEEGQLPQDSPSRHAPTQAAGKAQDAPRASPVATILTEQLQTNGERGNG